MILELIERVTRSRERDPDKSNQDWIDIRKLVELHHLSPADEVFAELVLRYGGQDALDRIRRICED